MKHHFELVFMFLYDVGRSVDLDQSRRLIPASTDHTALSARDTPTSLSVPAPLQTDVAGIDLGGGSPVKRLSLSAKIYEDGVVSMIARADALLELEELHTVRAMEFDVPMQSDGSRRASRPGRPTAAGTSRMTISSWAHAEFDLLCSRLEPAITRADYPLEAAQKESYTAICLVEQLDDNERFLDEHSQYLSKLLLGENPGIRLHRDQIRTTLDHRFSFKDNDLIVLDLDRCFIIDPDRDYEDILLILELANYQLVELRTLDRLLDRWLDTAENDIRRVYLKRSHRARFLSRKIGDLIPLRLDALFILENLENTSKIIGDYYLGQVYQHLCTLMGTAGWERSVRRRLEALQDIYSMAKVDVNERLLLIMEILVVLLIAFEVIALLFPLLPR